MNEALRDILDALETQGEIDARQLTKLINRNNKRLVEAAQGVGLPADGRPLSKKKLMEHYLKLKRTQPALLEQWGVTPELDRRMIRTLQIKPRRTASGVATITVLTKPWPCSSDCRYCPNDVRMPKSYLTDEPACQRAERNCFDPYLQVSARLRTLIAMGHVTDKVELIVLGGTFSDYPQAYQIWFMHELFRALNEYEEQVQDGTAVAEHRAFYEQAGITGDYDELAAQTFAVQQQVNNLELSYNQAFPKLYHTQSWQRAAKAQTATMAQLREQHATNESAAHRVVGLVIETRPDNVNLESLAFLRALGCTKIQMGVQSLDAAVLAANNRTVSIEQIQCAFEATRLLGFKTHVHAMVNLYGSNPEADKADYRRLVNEEPWQPDEIKLYPCALIGGTQLCRNYEDGTWAPYSEEVLVDVLAHDVCVTPPFCRISRMIRDFSAPDIEAGNKKVNLRQMVEARIKRQGLQPEEMRQREISLTDTSAGELHLDVVSYTTSNTEEHFLQWITDDNALAGFLRLSLPSQQVVTALSEVGALPSETIAPGEAMIREVHVYGRVAGIHATSGSAQHQGLGTQLVQRACELAAEAGFTRINVISAVGTRGYYRKLGFYDDGLYQRRNLER